MDANFLPVQGPGHPLQGPHWQPERSLEAADVPPLRLVVQPGGALVEVTRPEVVVGRHSQADVCLRLPDISRRHCRLIYQDGQWHIFDLQSLNGVYVNDQRVEHAQLRQGDVIGIANLHFEVDLEGGPAIERTPRPGIIRRIGDALPPAA